MFLPPAWIFSVTQRASESTSYSTLVPLTTKEETPMSTGSLESLAIFAVLLGVLPALSVIKRPSSPGIRDSISLLRGGFHAIGEALQGVAESAKFDGDCHACGEHFSAGTRIRWSEGVGAKHVSCS